MSLDCIVKLYHSSLPYPKYYKKRFLQGTDMDQAGCIQGIEEAPVKPGMIHVTKKQMPIILIYSYNLKVIPLKNIVFENVYFRRYKHTYWGSFVENHVFVHSNPLLFGPNADQCYT